MRYETHFCASADGTRIAYAVAPGIDPPVVMITGWPGTIELVASDIAPHPLIHGNHTSIWADRRGLGASQRDVDDVSLDRQVEDLAAIIDDYGRGPVHLHGTWDGTPIAIAYAALYPDKLLRMALVGPYARGEDIISSESLQSTVDVARSNWSLTRRSLAAIAFISPEDQGPYMELLRRGISPDMAAAYLEQYGTMDVTEYLGRVQVSTIVMARAHDPAVPRAATEFVASRLPKCRFVTLADRETSAAAVQAFFWGDEAISPAASPGTGTAIILFADIVDSTALTERIGDAAFREKARGLDEAMRAAIRANGGTAIEGKTLGDGVLAVFTSAKQAITCAQACHSAASDAGLALHAGIHAGDVIRESDPDGRGNVYGGAVNIAARVASASVAGETLVSATVRDLARTSAGVSFEDRGEQALKGIDDAIRLFAVS